MMMKPELVFDPKPEIEKMLVASPLALQASMSSIFCIWVRNRGSPSPGR